MIEFIIGVVIGAAGHWAWGKWGPGKA